MRHLVTALLSLAFTAACGRSSSSPAADSPAPSGPGGAVVTGPGLGPTPELPPPDTSRQVAQYSRLVPWPGGRTPVAPPGFAVSRFADGLVRPRWIFVLPNGDVLVAESASSGAGRDTLLSPAELAARWASGNRGQSPNRIVLLRDADRDGRAERVTTLLWGLKQPVGMAYLDGWLYVGNTDELVRFPYRLGDTTIQAPPRRVLELPAGGYNNHWTRNVVANAAGTKLYVTVGSGTNVDTEAVDVKDERRAAVLELNPDGSEMRVFASGLRNPLGLDWAPHSNALWTVVNERDGLGDELVPDYLTSVRQGAFYGWPYAYFGQHEEPRQRGRRPDLVAEAVAPDYGLGSHTASLSLAFYRGEKFPEPWRSGAYVGQHGSWNRSSLTGYRVLFVPFEGGRPAGPPREFLGGFIADSASFEVHGRPLGVAVHPDGALLVADDPSGIIWRVAYEGAGGPAAPSAEGPRRAQRIATVTGLARPEGARWDPEQKVWFISNINGTQARDSNGFVTRLKPDGTVDSLRFIAGGRDDVTLHAPKGMAISGDTLWVADLDAVRGFDRRTGAPLGSHHLGSAGALFLNDVTVGPDGSLYITDTGVRFEAGVRKHTGPDRVFRVRGGRVSVVLEGDWLGQPNGITWDPVGRRFLLAPVAGDSSVSQWTEGSPRPEPLARGAGRYDGVEVLPGGRILVAGWNDSTVSEVVGKEIRPVITGVPAAADIGLDPEGLVVAIPVLLDGRVELWRLPR